MSQQLILEIEDNLHGKRIDAALSAIIDDMSRSTICELITNGKVVVEDKLITKPSFKVSSGNKVCVTIEQEQTTDIIAQDIPLNIVYEDDDVLVINKPINFVVHPGAGINQGTVMNALLYHYPESRNLDRAGIVHRLDKDTSGLMVVAKSSLAQIRLVRAISKHQVVREYEAIAEGLISSGGTIDRAIGRDLNNRTRMAVLPEGMGREAITHYRVMEQYRAHTRIKLRLETGRTHQIRVHMASIDHPLLGDSQYGGKRVKHLKGASETLDQALVNFKHQALHASHIEFTHPVTREEMSFDAPLPDDFVNIINLLKEDYLLHKEELD